MPLAGEAIMDDGRFNVTDSLSASSSAWWVFSPVASSLPSTGRGGSNRDMLSYGATALDWEALGHDNTT